MILRRALDVGEGSGPIGQWGGNTINNHRDTTAALARPKGERLAGWAHASLEGRNQLRLRANGPR